MENIKLIDETMGSLLERWATEMPNHDFLVYPDRDLRFSYAQFNARVDNLACALLALGVQQAPNGGLGC